MTPEHCKYRGLRGTDPECGQVKLGGLLCPTHDLTKCGRCDLVDTTGRARVCRNCGEPLGLFRDNHKP